MEEDEEEIEEVKNCMLCKKKLELKENVQGSLKWTSFKNAYIIVFAECEDYCEDIYGSRYDEDFLLCEDCFEKYGIETVELLAKLKEKSNGIK